MKPTSHSTRSAPWSLAIAGMATVTLLSLGACASASAEPPPVRLVSMGERLAKENCGGCHAMGANDSSALPDAPPFRDLRGRYSRDAMAQVIAERMEVIHPRMPLLLLDVDEVPEFLKYWDSVQPAAATRARHH